MKTILLLAICGLATANAQEIQTLSLDQTLALAQKNNIDFKIAKQETEKQLLLKKTAFVADPLQITYQGGQFNGQAFDHNLSIQQFFPMPKVAQINRQWQDELAKLTQKKQQLSMYELQKIITISYYQCLYVLHLQQLNQASQNLYANFVKAAETRLKSGDTSALELLSAQAKMREIALEKEQLAYDLAIYHKQLQYWAQSKTEIHTDPTSPQKYASKNLNPKHLEAILTGIYEQQNLVLTQEAAHYKAQRLPKWGLGYFAQSIDQKFLFQGFTLGLQIPLFNQAQSAKAEAVGLLQNQQKWALEKQLLQLAIRQQEQNLALEKQEKTLAYYQNQGLDDAKKISQYAQKNYAQGDISYWVYVGFLQQSLQLKKQHLESLNAYNQAAILADFPSLTAF